MNLTEPQAGSDLSAVRTRAEPVQDVFQFDRGNVLAAGDNHVLRTVLDAHVAIRLDHREIVQHIGQLLSHRHVIVALLVD